MYALYQTNNIKVGSLDKMSLILLEYQSLVYYVKLIY